MAKTTPCHICGRPVKLRPATVEEANRHGYDATYEGEYLIGRCHALYDANGLRNHYVKPVSIVYHADADDPQGCSECSLNGSDCSHERRGYKNAGCAPA